MRFILLVSLLVACSAGPFESPSSPDATTIPLDDAGLPSCASVGCASGDLLCTRAGACTCPQPDGSRLECERVGVDAGTPAPVDSETVDATKIVLTDAAHRENPDSGTP
jgi:hypothetical protein